MACSILQMHALAQCSRALAATQNVNQGQPEVSLLEGAMVFPTFCFSETFPDWEFVSLYSDALPNPISHPEASPESADKTRFLVTILQCTDLSLVVRSLLISTLPFLNEIGRCRWSDGNRHQG